MAATFVRDQSSEIATKYAMEIIKHNQDLAAYIANEGEKIEKIFPVLIVIGVCMAAEGVRTSQGKDVGSAYTAIGKGIQASWNAGQYAYYAARGNEEEMAKQKQEAADAWNAMSSEVGKMVDGDRYGQAVYNDPLGGVLIGGSEGAPNWLGDKMGYDNDTFVVEDPSVGDRIMAGALGALQGFIPPVGKGAAGVGGRLGAGAAKGAAKVGDDIAEEALKQTMKQTSDDFARLHQGQQVSTQRVASTPLEGAVGAGGKTTVVPSRSPIVQSNRAQGELADATSRFGRASDELAQATDSFYPVPPPSGLATNPFAVPAAQQRAAAAAAAADDAARAAWSSGQSGRRLTAAREAAETEGKLLDEQMKLVDEITPLADETRAGIEGLQGAKTADEFAEMAAKLPAGSAERSIAMRYAQTPTPLRTRILQKPQKILDARAAKRAKAGKGVKGKGGTGRWGRRLGVGLGLGGLAGAGYLALTGQDHDEMGDFPTPTGGGGGDLGVGRHASRSGLGAGRHGYGPGGHGQSTGATFGDSRFGQGGHGDMSDLDMGSSDLSGRRPIWADLWRNQGAGIATGEEMKLGERLLKEAEEKMNEKSSKKPAHGLVIVIGSKKAGPGPSTEGKRDKLDSEKKDD